MALDHENPLITERRERTRWLLSNRFGMFIHWGLYVIPARGEWVRSSEKISVKAYQFFSPNQLSPITSPPTPQPGAI